MRERFINLKMGGLLSKMKPTYNQGTLQAHFEPKTTLRDNYAKKSDVQRRNERFLPRNPSMYGVEIKIDLRFKYQVPKSVINQQLLKQFGRCDSFLGERVTGVLACDSFVKRGSEIILNLMKKPIANNLRKIEDCL